MAAFLIFFVGPVLIGVYLGRFFRQRMAEHPTALPWPPLSFLVILGAVAGDASAVWYTGTEMFFPGEGGFLGDNFTVLVYGLIFGIFALSGFLASCSAFRLGNGKTPSPLSAWCWSWLLSQSALQILILVLGQFSFQSFAGDWGLPMEIYILIVAIASLALGLFFGQYREKSHGPWVPLMGLALVCAAGLLLAQQMLRQAHHDPSWGLDLVQTTAGMWYSRLFLPSAVLLGDYQYRWDITPTGIYLFTVAPHVIFAAGYLTSKLFLRGIRHDDAHSEN